MTNQLFRDYLDGKIVVRSRIRPGVYFLPSGSFDPSAPTMRDLEAGINLTPYVTIMLPPQVGLTTAAREEDHKARNRAISEAAGAAGQSFAGMEAALMAMGAAARNALHAYPEYVIPPPKPWAGNIATQKRRRKL